MSDTPINLPSDLARVLIEYMKPEDVSAATLVTTSPQPATTKMTIYVSYVPRLRSSPHTGDGLGEIRASSMPKLLSKLAGLWPDVEFSLVLSMVARAEIAARRKGVPRAEGWS